MMLVHFIKLHWRTVLAVVVLGLLIWACLPAPWKTRLADGWKKFGHAIGNFNARVILTLLYATLMALFGLPVRFFADSMHMKKRPSTWFDHPPIPNTLDEARRQG